MKHAFIALAATAVLMAGAGQAAAQAVCADLIDPAMIENACGIKMKAQGFKKQKADQCAISFKSAEQNSLELQIFSANNTGDAGNRFKRKTASAERNAAPEKADKRKADGMSYTQSFEAVAGIGQGAYAVTINNPVTGKHHFEVVALTGLHEVHLRSKMGLMGKTTPCDAAQLQSLATEVVGRMGN